MRVKTACHKGTDNRDSYPYKYANITMRSISYPRREAHYAFLFASSFFITIFSIRSVKR